MKKTSEDEAKARRKKGRKKKEEITGAYSPNDIPCNPYPCASKHIALKKKRIFVEGGQAVNKLEKLTESCKYAS
jgi:hypothetical protein